MKTPFKNIRGFIQALRRRCYNVRWMCDDDRVFVDFYCPMDYEEFVVSLRSFTSGRVAYLKVTELPVEFNEYLVESRFMINVTFY